jgi:DNA-directed RNA polymerase specialized sigma24 family protein
MTQVGVNLLRDSGRQSVRIGGQRMRLDELTPPQLRQLVAPRFVDDVDELPDHHFREVFATLPAQDRELLELYAIDDLTHAESAVQLKLPSAAASRQRLLRLRSHLAEQLREHRDPEFQEGRVQRGGRDEIR